MELAKQRRFGCEIGALCFSVYLTPVVGSFARQMPIEDLDIKGSVKLDAAARTYVFAMKRGEGRRRRVM